MYVKHIHQFLDEPEVNARMRACITPLVHCNDDCTGNCPDQLTGMLLSLLGVEPIEIQETSWDNFVYTHPYAVDSCTVFYWVLCLT